MGPPKVCGTVPIGYAYCVAERGKATNQSCGRSSNCDSTTNKSVLKVFMACRICAPGYGSLTVVALTADAI
jgi:hypothetical protein